MDPNVTYQIWLWALMVGNPTGAKEAATNLVGWLAKGGFAPDWAAGQKRKGESAERICQRFNTWCAVNGVGREW